MGKDGAPFPHSARYFLAITGCSLADVDEDGDGVCNSFRPRFANGHVIKIPSRWCSGFDNCNHVYNPDQRMTLDVDADSREIWLGDDRGDACVTSTRSNYRFVPKCNTSGLTLNLDLPDVSPCSSRVPLHRHPHQPPAVVLSNCQCVLTE